VTPSAEPDERAAATAGRITTSLVPRTARELASLTDETGYSKSDVINRAISLYAFVMAQIEAGNDLMISDRTTGETRVVHLL
jgi:hypothetical protein